MALESPPSAMKTITHRKQLVTHTEAATSRVHYFTKTQMLSYEILAPPLTGGLTQGLSGVTP